MNPTATNAQGTNTHSYPAYDYPVGIGTGLVAVKSGIITDFPGVPTRYLMSLLQNGQAWPNAGGGSPNSGNVITISHGNGEYTCYLHCSPFDVNAYRGRRVKQGEVFAKSGHNGWSTGPHLHFEVWRNGSRIDPGPWLASIKKEEEEPMFNEGDRVNVNRALFGEDKGFWKDKVEKMSYKTALEGILSSGEYLNESRINTGDAGNMAKAGMNVQATKNATGKLWKNGVYEDFIGYFSGSEYEVIPEPVYKKKG